MGELKVLTSADKRSTYLIEIGSLYHSLRNEWVQVKRFMLPTMVVSFILDSVRLSFKFTIESILKCCERASVKTRKKCRVYSHENNHINLIVKNNDRLLYKFLQ